MSILTKETIDEYVDHQISRSFQQAEKERLERLKELLLKRQFIDAPSGLTSDEYRKWLQEAKLSYILSLPTQSLLMGDIHHYPTHSEDELNACAIGNLSPEHIIEILDSLDLYTIMGLIANEVQRYYPECHLEVQDSNDEIELSIETPGRFLYTLAVRPFTRSISEGRSYYFRDGVRSINGESAYELLYLYLRMPIATILSSVNEVNTHIPCDIPFDDKLCSVIEKIQRDDPTLQPLRKRKK